MALVTCDQTGNALLTWLATATEAEKDQLRTALGVAKPDFAPPLTDCADNQLLSGESVVTCVDYEEKLATLKTLESGSFNPATKILTLVLTNGDTVAVDIEYPDCN